MGKRHEYFEWLKADKAAEYLGDLWGELITPDTLMNLCMGGDFKAYLMPPAGGLHGKCLTPQDALPRNASLRGILCHAYASCDDYQQIISPINLDWVTGTTMIIALRGDINMTICPYHLPDHAKSSQPTTTYRLNNQCWDTELSRELFHPLFRTEDIRAFADKMNGKVDQPEAASAETPKFEQKCVRQVSAIVSALQDLTVDPLKIPQRQPGNKKWIKSQVKEILIQRTDLFTKSSFDHAWDRARKSGEIGEICDCPQKKGIGGQLQGDTPHQ
ncbi:MAG: hypothetical protein P4N59_20285 [Negativicutes bacterium]|nr:hypothetical protein [Negativicutes bacterium]